MNLPICLPENLDSLEIRSYTQQFGLDFTLHLPEEIDVTSFHPPIRNGHLERCKQAMEWADSAGIKTLNMHLNNGIYFTLPQTKVWINEQYEDHFLELLYQSFSTLYRLADSFDIELCIENTGNFHFPFIRKALDKLNGLNNFCLTWDVGHDAKAGFVDEPVFAHFTSRIRHMHLHDYNGKSDHQPLYTGVVPINNRLDFARNNNLSVVIETKTSESLTESVARLKNSGYVKARIEE